MVGLISHTEMNHQAEQPQAIDTQCHRGKAAIRAKLPMAGGSSRWPPLSLGDLSECCSIDYWADTDKQDAAGPGHVLRAV